MDSLKECENNDVLKNMSVICEPNSNGDTKIVSMNPDDEKQVSQKNDQMTTADSDPSNKNTSLGLLATYGSSSDSDSEMDDDGNDNAITETAKKMCKPIKNVPSTSDNESLKMDSQLNVGHLTDKSITSNSVSEPDSESEDNNAKSPIDKQIPIVDQNTDTVKNIVDGGSYRNVSSSDEENRYTAQIIVYFSFIVFVIINLHSFQVLLLIQISRKLVMPI